MQNCKTQNISHKTVKLSKEKNRLEGAKEENARTDWLQIQTKRFVKNRGSKNFHCSTNESVALYEQRAQIHGDREKEGEGVVVWAVVEETKSAQALEMKGTTITAAMN